VGSFGQAKSIVWKNPPKGTPNDAAYSGSQPERETAMSIEMDDAGIERIIDIIGDGDLTAEAQEKLRQEGLWPLYESLRQTAYDAFDRTHEVAAKQSTPRAATDHGSARKFIGGP
jgi:hypothetical protein